MLPSLALLKQSLPEADWQPTLSALRQDALIWQAVQDEEIVRRVKEQGGGVPADWSPAALGLAALQVPLDPQTLRQIPLAGVEPALARRAAQTFERFARQRTRASRACSQAVQPALAQAALLALALRERRRLTGNWQGLGEELRRVAEPSAWQTPVACLYGMVSDPLEMLVALLPPQPDADTYRLILHALLSNPLSAAEQLTALQSLQEHLASEALGWLNAVAESRPDLASQLAQKYIDELPAKRASAAAPFLHTPIDLIGQALHQAEIYRLAGRIPQALDGLERAQALVNRLSADLAARQAQTLAQAAQTSSTAVIHAWQQAVELAPDETAYRAALALALLDAGRLAEAALHLEQPTTFAMRLAAARLAALQGDPAARDLALAALAEAHQAATAELACLAEILLDSHAFAEAARAAALAVERQPANPRLLALWGQAQAANSHFPAAAEAYQLAVLLAAHEPAYRRQLAACLEALGDFENALAERRYLVQEPAAATRPEYLSDLRALAACALQAARPAMAAEACEQVLALDPHDGEAHADLAEAHAALGNLQAAKDHWLTATRLAPHLAHPWLALSQALTRTGHADKAIETLRAAVQALPANADLQLALGQACLDAGSPTQALPALQQAFRLAADNRQAALRLGQTLRQLGHAEEARRTLASAFQQCPNDPEVAYAYARALLDVGQVDEALDPLALAIAASPPQAAPYLDYARALLDKGRNPEAAVAAIENVLTMEASPDEKDEAQALLGDALSAQGDLPAALSAYQTALKSALAADEAWRERLTLGLGQVAMACNKPEVAVAALQEAVQAAPADPRPQRLLCEAYRLAGLPHDALKAARRAFDLARDDLDTLLWFAEQALELGEPQVEIVALLKQAAPLVPAHPQWLLRLGKIQASVGDRPTAAQTLQKVAASAEAMPADLQQAAQLLSELDEPALAADCLERLANQQQSDSRSAVATLDRLAQLYQRAGNTPAALQALARAIALDPTNPAIYQAQADILLSAGYADKALACLEDALSRLPDDAGLRQRAAMILRSRGRLEEALAHIEAPLAAAGAARPSGAALSSGAEVQVRILAAEMARALLRPTQARAWLNGLADTTGEANFHCLRVELALEAAAEIEAGVCLTAALAALPTDAHTHPRFLAAQARLTIRRGQYAEASQMLTEALKSHESVPDLDGESLLALAEAWAELWEWDRAILLARRASNLASQAAAGHLSLASILARRAEFQHLCQAAGVVAHAPGKAALAEHSRASFEAAIRAGRRALGKAATTESEAIVSRWQARGLAAFHPSLEASRALANLPADPRPAETLAARLAVLRMASPPDEAVLQQAIEEARNSPAHPLLQMQLALLVARNDPGEALAIVHKLPPALAEPLAAIGQALTAHFALASGDLPAARGAIETALGLWPNEPHWHRLAAHVARASDDAAAAVEHLEAAVRLEPKVADHHLALGQALLAQPHLEAAQFQGALRAIERACQLDPELAPGWLTLAMAHKQAGHFDEARRCAEKAAALAPQEAEPFILLAELALLVNDAPKAYAHAQSAATRQPHQTPAAIILARALEALHRPDEAIAALEQAISASDDPLPLHLTRLRLLRQAGKSAAALEAASELVRQYPRQLSLLAELAQAQAETGQFDAAIESARTALKEASAAQDRPGTLDDEVLARLHHLLGSLLRKAGQLDQAIYHLNEAVAWLPSWVKPYLDLGLAHQERRQFARAVEVFKQATRAAPRDYRPYYRAGLALKEVKDYPAAEAMLRRAAALAPQEVGIRRQLAAVAALNLVHSRSPLTHNLEV